MEHNKKNITRYFILVFLIFCFASLGLGFFSKYSKSEKVISLTYKETTDINYNVYLKENNFFDVPFLSKDYLSVNDRYIITQLIDYIDMTFNYNMSFDKDTSGNYYYYLKAVVEANKPNEESGSYWEKEYILYEGEKTSFSNVRNYSFAPNIKIDYNEYSNKIVEIMKNSNLTMDGKVTIYLVNQTTIDSDIFDEDNVISSEAKVSMPLVKSSMQLNLDSSNASKNDTISKTFKVKSSKYTICVICLVFCGLSILALIRLIIHYIKSDRKRYKFEIKLKKILNTYDSIIVNVNILPNLNEFKVINVESFEELVDAHGEVRMPINYYKKDDDRHVFILINNDVLWFYSLNRKK